MKFKINLQSVSDIITNSSSEIYTVATDTTIEKIKDLINNLLKSIGSEKTCDDLFDIHIEIPNLALEDPDEFIIWFVEEDDAINELPENLKKHIQKLYLFFTENEYGSKNWEKKINEAQKLFHDYYDTLKTPIDSYVDCDGDGYYDNGLLVEAKDKNNEYAVKVAEMLSGLGLVDAYDQSATYG